MPFAIAEGSTAVTIQGDYAVAEAVCVVTDDAGTELAREPITARVNHGLRADDPNRRGMQVDARDRLQQLLAEEAATVATRVLTEAVPLAKFDGLEKELAALVEARHEEVAVKVAEVVAAAETVPEVITKDLGTDLLASKGVLVDG